MQWRDHGVRCRRVLVRPQGVSLDWFHLSMKLTVLGQYGKGLVQCEAVLGATICDQIERLQWSLWHGQVDKALGKIDALESSIESLKETYARYVGLVKALSELRT